MVKDKDKKWLIVVGWTAYILTWVALFANIANDWLTNQWVSPLSIIIFVILGGGTIVQLLRKEPIIQTEGATNRLLITFVLILIVWVFILGRIVLTSLG